MGGKGRVTLMAYSSDHELGATDFSLTAEYQAKSSSLRTKLVYKVDDSSRAHCTYSVSDERLERFGIEKLYQLGNGFAPVLDLAYSPDKGDLHSKLTYRSGDLELAGWMKFREVPSKGFTSQNAIVEVKRSLPAKGSLSLTHDFQAQWSRIQLTQELDEFNSLKASCSSSSQRQAHLSAELRHKVSPSNDITFAANWGKKRYAVEWKNKVADGKWSTRFEFPFDGSPSKGDLSIKRRFDF